MKLVPGISTPTWGVCKSPRGRSTFLIRGGATLFFKKVWGWDGRALFLRKLILEVFYIGSITIFIIKFFATHDLFCAITLNSTDAVPLRKGRVEL